MLANLRQTELRPKSYPDCSAGDQSACRTGLCADSVRLVDREERSGRADSERTRLSVRQIRNGSGSLLTVDEGPAEKLQDDEHRHGQLSRMNVRKMVSGEEAAFEADSDASDATDKVYLQL